MDISITDAIFSEMVLRCMIYWLSTVKCILINACQKFYVNDCDQNLTFCDGFFFSQGLFQNVRALNLILVLVPYLLRKFATFV